MALTAQDVIDQGYAKSAAARVESIATPNELVTRIGQCLREIFFVLARENPYVLGAQAVVAFNSVGWSRPADCIRAIKVLANGGTVANPAITPGKEINVVPFNDQLFCKNQPSVTELGQAFIPVGQTMDPTGGTLTVVYARAPIVPVQTTDPIDTLFPAFFSDVLNFDMAAYLATKDQREVDAQSFIGMKAGDMQQMIQWSRAQTYSVKARFLLVNPPVTNANGGRQTPAEQ